MPAVRGYLLALLGASCLAYSGQARAQPTAPIELKWNALEGCPKAETVLSRVRQIAGPTRPTPNTLRAEATITQPSEGLFRMRLEIRSGELAAVRNIEGKSCKDLAGAAAVALALLLSSEEPLSQGDLAGTASTSSSSATSSSSSNSSSTSTSDNQESNQPATPTSNPPIPPPAIEPPTPPPSSAESAPRRWRVLLVAPLGALSFGPMRQMSRGLGLGVGFSYDRWRFLAEGKLWASQHETVTGLGAEYGVELKRFTVNARACRSLTGPRFEFAPCALVSAHHLSVTGSGLNLVSTTDTVTWAAVGIGMQARLLVSSWFGLVAGVDAEVQLSRPEVYLAVPAPGPGGPVATETRVARLAPAAATIMVGSQWIF